VSERVAAQFQDAERSSDAERLIARVIFIGGSPRSGTTLVQNILDSHPDVLGGPEFLHLPDILELRRKLKISVDKEWISLICGHADVDARIATLIADLLLPFADRHGARVLSEKTPENVLVFPDLVDLLPGVKLVHVVRDPRATVASLLDVADRARAMGEAPAPFAASLDAAITQVRRCLESGFRAAERAPESVFTIVYEQLVAEHERIARELCSFIGLDWHPAMTTPGDVRHLGEAAITTNSKEVWYDAQTYYSNPNTSSVDKWRDRLSAADQYLIARGFARSKGLRTLGYDLAPRGGTAARLWGRLGAACRDTLGRARRALDRIGTKEARR
jgi:hypothetical protein